MFRKLLVASLLWLCTVSAHAAIRTVTSTADSGAGSLRATIAAAVANDTIEFNVAAPIVLTTAQISIAKNLTIRGPGANRLHIVRSDGFDVPEFRIFEISASVDVSISGVTIANGRAAYGGGISNAGTLSLDECAFEGNRATGTTASAGGGAVFAGSSGELTVDSCTFSGNSSANRGGGVFSYSTLDAAKTTIKSSTFSGNIATEGGGLFNYNGQTNIRYCTFAKNSADSAKGGGIASYGDASTLTKIRSTIVDSTSDSDVTYVVSSTNSFDSDGYNLVGTGNAVANFNQSGDQINGDAKLGPLAYNGGSTKTHFPLLSSPAIDKGDINPFDFIYYDQRHRPREVDIDTITNASSGTDVGAVEANIDAANYVVTTLDDEDNGGCGTGTCTLREALAPSLNGGSNVITFAPGLTGTINLLASLPDVHNNTIRGPGANVITVARSSGGGVDDFRIFTVPAGYTANISGLTIKGGNVYPDGNGGGIYNAGSLTVQRVAVEGCTSYAYLSGSGRGGGIANAKSLVISDSTISGNAARVGGGISSYPPIETPDQAVFTSITNCTISGNSSSGGAGLAGTSLTVVNSTITANTVGGITGETGGGASVTGMTMKNSILAGNSSNYAGKDCSGSITSLGYNLIESSAGCTITGTTTGNITGLAANLGPLANNGGTTRTHLPAAGSPAIDAGLTDVSTHFDQRLSARPEDLAGSANAAGGNAADIGAVEIKAPTKTYAVNSLNDVDDGTCNVAHCSLREAVNDAVVNPSADTINFVPGLAGKITLLTALPNLNSSLTINGPGADVLTVSRSTAAGTPQFRIFFTAEYTTVAISGLTVSNGAVSSGGGGGIRSDGPFTLSKATISGNFSSTTGGGLLVSNDSKVENCTITGNTASTGGGVYSDTNLSTERSLFVNCTISYNNATTSTGGFYNLDGNAELQSCTIGGNTATAHTGISSFGDNLTRTTLKNTIVSNETDLVDGAINSYVSVGYNLVESGNGIAKFNQPGDITGAPAKLNTLQSNGGPTKTQSLQAGSPAINKGNGGPAQDQRGYNRNGVPDIGAFEFGGTLPPDATPPAVSIAVPQNGSSVKTFTAANGVAIDNSGGSGINKVDVTLKRLSDNKFWSGTAWVAASTNLVTGINSGTWAKNTWPPAGTNATNQLLEGKYILSAVAKDNSNNSSPTVTSTFTVDRTVPSGITIINPPPAAKVKVLPKVNGTATDAFEVAQVVLLYKRNSDNKYWTGTVWGAQTELPTTIAGPVNNRTWSKSTGLPAGADLPLGNYGVIAIAIDAAGNRTQLPRSFDITETVPPTATITTPANASTVTTLTEISGTAQDTGGSNLQRVALTLRRTSDNKFWNGTAWVATSFDLSTSMTTAGSGVTWKCLVLPKNANLIDSAYKAQATAWDKAGNDSPTVVSLFTLKRPSPILAPETQASKVQLSTATATSGGVIQLSFTGPLASSATDVLKYTVVQNDEAVEIVSAQQKSPGVIVLTTEGLTAGAQITVTYDLLDTAGDRVAGSATVAVK